MQHGTDETINYQKPTRVLVIEEHRGVRNALSQTLLRRKDMLPVYIAPYLPSRPEQLLEFQPQVILIGLPQSAVGNLETIAEQVRYWARRNIKVIVLSTYQDSMETAVLHHANVFAHILKTVDFGELANLIHQAATVSSEENIHV